MASTGSMPGSSDKGVISIRSVPDDREIQSIVSDPTKLGCYLLFSPDGQYLASSKTATRCRCGVWPTGSRSSARNRGKSAAWAFSPDSRQLAVGQQGWILRFDLATGQEINRWPLPGSGTRHAWPFTRTTAGWPSATPTSSVASVYDATNGKLVAEPAGRVRSIEQVVAWHPDGDRLAVAGSDPRIQIWDVAAKRKLATLEGHVQQVTCLSFHPDGDLLASAPGTAPCGSGILPRDGS